jgi:hypothetical protein
VKVGGGRNPIPEILLKCENPKCGQMFPKRSNTANKYCSRSCSNKVITRSGAHQNASAATLRKRNRLAKEARDRKEMRALIIDETAKAEVRRVEEYARKKENWYFVGSGGKMMPEGIPGHDPHYVAQLGSYRCVFTYTMGSKGLVRHLSIGVPGGFPNTIAVAMIATEFGFTGWDGKSNIETLLGNGTWRAKASKEQQCVIVIQLTPEGFDEEVRTSSAQ